MSNNSYLYAVKLQADSEPRYTQIGYHPYDSPLLFLLLCSGNPRQVPSHMFITKAEENIAICGDFTEGFARIRRFMDRCVELNHQHSIIDETELQALTNQVHATLTDPRLDGCTHFLLEAAELFAMLCQDMEQAARRLLIQTHKVQDQAEERLQSIFLTQWTAPEDDDATEDNGFFIPDFDTLSDEEYFEFIREDFEDADRDRDPLTKLHYLGFSSFGIPCGS